MTLDQSAVERDPFAHSLPRLASQNAVGIDDFRAGMRRLTGAVTVLTTVHDGRRSGLTATAVCSLSAEPPRLVACVNLAGSAFLAFRRSRLLAVNLLSSEQVDVGQSFAGMRAEGETKFSVGAWTEGRLGKLPILKGCCCSFQCSIDQIIDAVSHALIICDIEQIETEPEARPLLYSDGRFATLHEPLSDPCHAVQF